MCVCVCVCVCVCECVCVCVCVSDGMLILSTEKKWHNERPLNAYFSELNHTLIHLCVYLDAEQHPQVDNRLLYI